MTAAAAITFLPAQPFEALELARLSRDLIETHLPWSWTPPRIRDAIRDPERLVLVARSGSQIAGFAVMAFAERHAHLDLLAVTPRWRRHGIGTRLLQWLEASADVAGIEWIDLEVRARNTEARSFYARLGYREHQLVPRYYRGRDHAREAAVRLRRHLRAGAPA